MVDIAWYVHLVYVSISPNDLAIYKSGIFMLVQYINQVFQCVCLGNRVIIHNPYGVDIHFRRDGYSFSKASSSSNILLKRFDDYLLVVKLLKVFCCAIRRCIINHNDTIDFASLQANGL